MQIKNVKQNTCLTHNYHGIVSNKNLFKQIYRITQCTSSALPLIQVSHSFTDKKSRAFPGLSRTFVRNFPGPFRSPWMLKYNEKPSPLLLTPVLPPLPFP